MGEPLFNSYLAYTVLSNTGGFTLCFENDSKLPYFYFLDVPHLIKLARNHLFSKGYLLPADSEKCRSTLKLEDFEKIVEENSKGVYQTAFKLTHKHLHLTGSQKQNVSLATQVFSHTIAKHFLHLEHLFRSKRDAKAKHDAVKLFNDWYVAKNLPCPMIAALQRPILWGNLDPKIGHHLWMF